MNKVLNIVKYTSSLKLLYVEDDELARESVTFLLSDFFESVIVGVDGQDGLEKFKNNDIDLIITDINMPKLDGIDMLQEIKKIDKNNTPMVILSAHIEPEYFIKSIKLNVKGYLIKPINMDSVLDVFENIISDIRLKAEIENNLKQEKQHHRYLQSIVDTVHDPIMVIRADYSVELMNSTLKQILPSLKIADEKNPKCYEISHHRSTPCDSNEYACPLKDVLESRETTTVIHNHNNTSGEKSYIELIATPLFDKDEKCIGIIESARDITTHIEIQEELREQKDRLHYLAHHDTLTNLANRVLFEDRLNQAILRAKRHKTKIALFFIDLNKFKQINDSLGHKVGDEVLKKVSAIMKEEIREEDSIARIGGDEFTIIIENIHESQEAKILANKVLVALEKPILYNENSLHISASFGISIYPDDTTDAQILLKYADIAMYKAKESGINILYFNKENK